MAAHIVKLTTSGKRLRAEQAAKLRQLVIDFDGLDAEATGRLVAAIDRETAAERGWTFVQLNAEQNDFVVDQLLTVSKRPQVAVRVWAKLFLHVRLDTDELMVTSAGLAKEVGAQVPHVSEVLTDLEDIGAISRRREGRGFRYFMNPRVGTGLAGAAREVAQAQWPPLRPVQGGKA